MGLAQHRTPANQVLSGLPCPWALSRMTAFSLAVQKTEACPRVRSDHSTILSMGHPDYNTLYQRACERKGGEQAVESLLPRVASRKKLTRLGSDRYLAEFTRKVFQSGFVWRVVDQKWKDFEEVFWGFDIKRLLMMPDDMLDRKAANPAIIRNHSKVKTIRDNAAMIADTERRRGESFGSFVANWPAEDVIGLWLYLKKEGSRLGVIPALRPAHTGCRHLPADRGCRGLPAQPRYRGFGHHQPACAACGPGFLQWPAGPERQKPVGTEPHCVLRLRAEPGGYPGRRQPSLRAHPQEPIPSGNTGLPYTFNP